MCLYTDQKKPLIATEDIIVYKECIITKNGGLRAAYVQHRYSKVETAPLRIVKECEDANFEHKISSGLHARIYQNSITNTSWIVPKGAKYYLGKNSDIASNKLIFKEFTTNNTPWNIDNINWEKPSISRWITKMRRYINGDY